MNDDSTGETREQRRDRERRERNERVPFDWRIVKVDWTDCCDQGWRDRAAVEAVFVYYLYDANRHVHICSLTPSQELWPVAAEVAFTSEQASEADEGQSEQEILNGEEACSYFDVSYVASMKSRPVEHPPEREPGETSEDYYMRAVEEMREHYQGNPPYFSLNDPA